MLVIRADLVDAMVAHARADHPDEACGIIAGPEGSDRPERHVAMINAERSPTFYRLDSAEHDLVGVARLIAIRRVGRDGNFLVVARADLSDFEGAALERRVERLRVRVHRLRRGRGDLACSAETQARRRRPDAGPAEQRAASNRGGWRGRRRQVESVEMVGWSAMEISSLAGTALGPAFRGSCRFLIVLQNTQNATRQIVRQRTK